MNTYLIDIWNHLTGESWNGVENVEAPVPVIAHTCYRVDEPGLRSAYSVRLRTGETRV